MQQKRQTRHIRGGVFMYILGAIALLALLIFSLTEGSQKSAITGQIDELSAGVRGDLEAITAAITECAITYSTTVDVDGDGDIDLDDNPNPLFPLYNIAGTKGGNSGAGVDLDFVTNNIVCPGTSTTGAANMADIFGPKNTGNLSTLTKSDIYTVNYRTNATEGVLLRITRSAASPVWDESGARINAKYSACKVAWVKDGVTDGGVCTNGCVYMWLVRLPTTAIAVSDDGATCTAP